MNRESLCNPGWTGTLYVEQVGFKHSEIHLPLELKVSTPYQACYFSFYGSGLCYSPLLGYSPLSILYSQDHRLILYAFNIISYKFI